MSYKGDIKKLRKEVDALRKAFQTAMIWIAQSNGAPLNGTDVKALIERSEGR